MQSEGGAVLVMVALFMASAIALVTFVIDVGQWFEHRRHLQVQADAAALAGGDMFAACFNGGGGNSAMFNEASKYAGTVGTWNGTPYGTSLYNAQVGNSYRGSVSVLYQSTTYADGSNGNDGTETQGPCNTAHLMFDVKATERNLPWFFGGGMFVPSINTHARVQLHALNAANPSMPLAVPDVNPKQVGVTFVNEATGAELTGCGGSVLSGTTCTYLLTKGTPTGGLNIWSGLVNVMLPAAPATIGERIGLGGQVGSCASTGGSGSYSCYDGSSTTNGLTMIRDYAVAHPPPPPSGSNMSAPALDGVWPTSCSGNGAFFFIWSGTCSGGVVAEVDYGTGSTAPPSTYHIRATVGATTLDLAPVSYDAARSAWFWALPAASSFSLQPQAQSAGISLAWEVNDTTKIIGGSACTTKNNNPCKGNFASAPQQRYYSGFDDLSGSGPIRSMQLTGGTETNGPASLVGGAAYTLTVTLGLAGQYAVHTPCPPPPSGQAYNCPTDPTVPLRLKAQNGNTTYAVDCGSINGLGGAQALADEIQNGCANQFSINNPDICPDPANPRPPDCAPVNSVGSGIKTGPIRTALNNRFAPGGNCLTNNYPTVSPSDRRVVILMLTDFSAFSNGASTQVPVVNFGAFYVTGWEGAVASCSTQNDAAPGGTPDTGEIWGHFITYVAIGGVGGSGICDTTGFTPCVPVLTQ
jgi:hypothetical protein